MKHKNNIKVILLAAAFMVGGALAVEAATVNYIGPGADLANPNNWNGTWTSADTLVISTNNNVTFPEGGFTLSENLPASSKIQMTKLPASAVMVECGGHSLNTTVLDCGLLHTKDSERYNPVVFSGGFTGVGRIENSSDRDCVYLTNGMFIVANGFKLNKWFDYLHVLKGAELVITDITGDLACCVGWNSSRSIVDVDAGRLRVVGRSAGTTSDFTYWRRIGWLGSSSNPGILKIRNGGEYVDDTSAPADYFFRCSVLIDGGAYIATNATELALRETFWCGQNGIAFAMTNGTLRVGQFGTGNSGIRGLSVGLGITDYAASGSRITFHNSQEIFGKKASFGTGTWEGRELNSCDGMVFARNSDRNSLVISGSENVYRSGWFVLGGKTNIVDVAGGSFSVTNRFCAYDGDGAIVRFRGGVADIESFHVTDGATNFTVEVSGDATVNISELTLARQTKFKFAVPESGFLSAPIRCGATGFYGNFRFEFDVSRFTWPASMLIIPLIRDEGGFAGWGAGGTALDLAALNAEYAEVLPVSANGRRCSLMLKENGKELCLCVPKGLIVTVR